MFGKKKEEDNMASQLLNLRDENKEAELAPVDEEVISNAANSPASRPSARTIIGKEVTVVGNFDSKDPIDLYGTIRGNVRSKGSLFIAENGSLVGEAAVENLKIDGSLEGTVLCNGLTELSSSAHMKGNLSTSALKTEDGSNFEGKLNMISKKDFDVSENTPDLADEPEKNEGPVTILDALAQANIQPQNPDK